VHFITSDRLSEPVTILFKKAVPTRHEHVKFHSLHVRKSYANPTTKPKPN